MIFSVHTSAIYARGNPPSVVLPNRMMHPSLILEYLHNLVYARQNKSEHSSSTRSSSHCNSTNHFGRVLIFIEISDFLYVLQRNGDGPQFLLKAFNGMDRDPISRSRGLSSWGTKIRVNQDCISYQNRNWRKRFPFPCIQDMWHIMRGSICTTVFSNT